MTQKRRQVPQRHGGNQARHGKRKPTHLVLQRDAETPPRRSLRRSGELSLLGQRKAEALGALRIVTDEEGLIERNTGIKACRHFPTFVKPGQSPKSRVIFAVEGFISYTWKKQQGEQGEPPGRGTK